MEAVHSAESRSWIHETKIKVRNFISAWKALSVHNELSITTSNLRKKAEMEFGAQCDDFQALIGTLEDDCDENKLSCVGEDEFIYIGYDKNDEDPEIPDDHPLETLRLQKQHIKCYKKDLSYRTTFHSHLRYRTKLVKSETVECPSTREALVPGYSESPLVILYCQFYKPMHSANEYAKHKRTPLLCPDREIAILSSQCLSELKDVYSCISDNPCKSSNSDNPCLNYPSSFFFVNNTFYNDFRSNINIDYSQVILNWSAEPGRGIGPFGSGKMEETKVEDLEIQLGYPYLYVHQGDCEHLLVFSDLRLYVPGRDGPLSEYPKFISTNKRMEIRCGSCSLNTARWVTYEDKRLPYDKFFFCDNCFDSFNGENPSVRAYSFIDRTAFL